MITAAPELGAMTSAHPVAHARGILVSIGHSEATYEQASAAVAAGVTMITHLFNAMRPLHHRNPGIFGVLGVADRHHQQQQEAASGGSEGGEEKRPYFGLIADGIHLHPATVKIAWRARPAGLVLVTDAMHMVGLPDGRYAWTNGEGEHFIVKRGVCWSWRGRVRSLGGRSVSFCLPPFSAVCVWCLGSVLAGPLSPLPFPLFPPFPLSLSPLPLTSSPLPPLTTN